ncbi:MAG: glucose-6-phosphate dehydrogenase [Candidatus Levybacteria bacterium]|nr:glucose-6-phosphate dehydrogenase [Candidatus Levybacteria bacterium]
MDSPEIFQELKSPFVLIIFGATGDLTHHKLIPGLLSLFNKKMLPPEFFIVGFSRRGYTDEEFRDSFDDLTKQEGWKEFSEHLHYEKGTFESESGYDSLIKHLNKLDAKVGACITRFFYLATPPEHYSDILDKLVSTKLSEGCGQGSNKWTRVVIEKPFGKDAETAKMLEEKLSKIFDEKQIFRVDHYLGKETVQNMLAFRFANSIFEPVWNNKNIDHVQITWAEKEGIENRGNFFDGVGMLRDVVQNHIMQLISSVAMEQPRSFTKEDVRNERAKVTRAVTLANKNVVRGQYDDYENEEEVEKGSDTETYVAMKLFVNTPRFQGVPFYIRSGKRMEKEVITISVVFIQTCHLLFKEYGCPEIGNVLTFRIQPDEGITLRLIAKQPGAKLKLGSVNMKFNYKDDFGTTGLDAYEKILLDIFAGDQILFSRSDEIQNSWKLLDNILKTWENEKNISKYASGSWGPEEGNALIEQDGKKWIK